MEPGRTATGWDGGIVSGSEGPRAPDGPHWEDLLRSAARLQRIVPDAVLVGGTAAAVHAGHRRSFDHDHVVADLRDRFDQVLAALEDTDGEVTARERRPVMVLGSLDGVETGVRNLIRTRPLEVQQVTIAPGTVLRVPTLPEMLRIKAWLVLKRNATRDHLDVAVDTVDSSPTGSGTWRPGCSPRWTTTTTPSARLGATPWRRRSPASSRSRHRTT